MKKAIMYLLLYGSMFILPPVYAQNQKKTYVSVKVFFCNTYCGGAYPSEEILNNFKKEVVFSNSSFILKKDSSKKEIKVTTDSNGVFKASLAPGKYIFYMTSQYNKKLGANFTSTCDTWLNRDFGELEILPKTKKYIIVYFFSCNPCEPPRP